MVATRALGQHSVATIHTICRTVGVMTCEMGRLLWLAAALVLLCAAHARKKHNNILLILADDLGYGDTSVPPFIGLHVKTPNLERMAQKGMVLKNYHTAAATCTPTRASILTGMYPWRVGIKAVYEYGERGRSNRDDWLPPVPTIPMVLSEANYSVSHSGKWHLGGMRLDDLTMRKLPPLPVGKPGGKRCQHPGPNQQGFQNYVSVLDGPGSPRQNHLQIGSKLYSQGCSHLIENDEHLTRSNITGYLTHCEAEHAIRAMNRSVAAQKPFYIQVWFHCPHGPLEEVPGWRHLLKRKGARPADLTDLYITMIADMDVQIGNLLKNIEALGIEKETLVVFTSDNGPEHFAGTTAGLKGNKRFIYEGGIRVPALMQWTGTIPANKHSDAFVVSTDLFPTFLDAAGVRVPAHIRLDGLSALPQLVPDYYKLFDVPSVAKHTPAAAPAVAAHSKQSAATALLTTAANKIKHSPDAIREDPELYRSAIRDRVTLWHNDYEGPRRTAAWIYDYKVLLDEKEDMSEMFDMKNDKYEKKNLLKNISSSFWTAYNFTSDAGHHTGATLPLPTLHGTKITLERVINDRSHPDVHVWIAAHMFRVLKDYAKFGNAAHHTLMESNPEWRYVPTLDSDYRMVGKRFNTPRVSEQQLINAPSVCAATACSCDIKNASMVTTLPFNQLGENPARYLNPGKVLDGARFLKLRAH